MLIFKIVPVKELQAVENTEAYFGSAHDRADGFLHFSTCEQLPDTLGLYSLPVPATGPQKFFRLIGP